MSSLGTASIDLVTNQKAMQQQLETMGQTITSWGRRLRSVMLPIFAGITGFQAFRAAIDQEDSIYRLEQAFGRLGVSVSDSMQRASDFADTLQNDLGIAGGDVMDLMRDIVQQSGLVGDELETMTRAAIGLARAHRMDQGTALQLLTRVLNDASFSLDRYGIVLDETLEGQDRFNALIQEGLSGLQEMEDDTGTFEGAMRRLRVELQSLAENVLMPILPVMTRIVQLIQRIAFEINANVLPALQAFGRQWMSIMEEMAGSVQKVFQPIINVFSQFGNAIAQIAMSIRVVIANAIDSATVQLLRFGVAVDEIMRNLGINMFGEGWADQARQDIDALLDQMSDRSQRILEEYNRQREEFADAMPTLSLDAGGGSGSAARRNMTGSYRPEALNNALQLNLLNREDLLERQLHTMRDQLLELREQHRLGREGVRMLEEVKKAIETLRFGFQ